MKLAGLLLLVAGWIIVVCAVAMFAAGTPRAVFVAAGMAVEALGLALAVRAHLVLGEERD